MANLENKFILDVELNADEAWTLAQFFKRAHFDTYKSCALGEKEAYAMRDAAGKVQDALARHGYNPR